MQMVADHCMFSVGVTQVLTWRSMVLLYIRGGGEVGWKKHRRCINHQICTFNCMCNNKLWMIDNCKVKGKS